jgi:hypothetical protein
MRFVIPSQTIAEYKHQQMPVYETLATIGTAAATGIAGAGASYGLGKLFGGGGGGSSSFPTYNAAAATPFVDTQQKWAAGLQPFAQQLYNQGQDIYNADLGISQKAQQYTPENIYNTAANQGIDFAQRGTAANIANQEAVTPGSQAQRQLAQNQLNAYIQGQVPQDVQQQINRTVAQNLGGGFNLFSGGGQAPQNFARNIGQTSLGLSQFGLSAAPTWQQLANQMVVSPTVGLQAGLQSQALGLQGLGLGLQANTQGLSSALAGFNPMYQSAQANINAAQFGANIADQNAENLYQSQANQYGANVAQQQNQQALGLAGAGLGLQGFNAANTANYYNKLGNLGPQQGSSAYGNQFGSDMMSSGGFYETPAAVQAAFGAGAIPAYYSGGGQSGYYNQGFQ